MWLKKQVRLIMGLLLVMGLVLQICPQEVCAKEMKNGEHVRETVGDLGLEEQKNILNQQIEQLDWESIEKLQEELQTKNTQLKDFDLKDTMVKVIQGKEKISVKGALTFFLETLAGDLLGSVSTIMRFVLLVLLCNVLQILSASFESKNTTKIAFFTCTMVILYGVIGTLLELVELARNTVDQLQQIMVVAIPSLIAFISASGYMTFATSISPLILGGLNVMVFLLKEFIFPTIIAVMLLDVVTKLSDSFKLDQFIALFYRAIKWGLRVTLIVSVSLMGLYKMTLPYVDSTMKKAALNVSTAFIPVIGDAVNGAVEFIMNCSLLVRNAYATGVMIWIVLLVGAPLVKMFAFTLLYHLAGAAIEPLGDKNMASIADKIAKGCEFLMSCVGTMALLTLAVLGICMTVGLGGY